jgi:hypothetical protein
MTHEFPIHTRPPIRRFRIFCLLFGLIYLLIASISHLVHSGTITNCIIAVKLVREGFQGIAIGQILDLGPIPLEACLHYLLS